MQRPGCNRQEVVQEACLTSIEDYSEDIEFDISPNPVYDFMEINLNNPENWSVEIFLLNTTGICLKSFQYQNNQPGESACQFDLSDIPSGIYFCRVKLGNEVITKKIIKL